MIGAFHQELECHPRRRRSVRGRALDDDRRGLAGVFERWKVLGPGQDLAAAFEPVLGRHALQRRDDRSFDARHRVAPRPRVLAGDRPPVGDSGAAGEGDAPVDDEELAVRPVVEPGERVPAQLLVRFDAAPGPSQSLQGPAPEGQAADGVDGNRDVDAVPRAVRERSDELIAHLPRLEDVELHDDRLGRAADRVEHRRVELRAVGEDLDVIPLMEGRLAGRLHRVEEALVVHRHPVAEAVVDCRCEEHHYHEPDEKDRARYGQPEHQRHGCKRASTARAWLMGISYV